MKRLFELAKENNHLKFLDPDKNLLVSFAELDDYVEFFSNPEKDLAFLYTDNSLESIVAFWNVIKSAHGVVLLSPQLNTDFKLQLEEEYSPSYIFDLSRQEIKGFSYFQKFKGKDINWFAAHKKRVKSISSEIKLLLSTSGTTGSPKLVKLSEANLIANATAIASYLPIQPDDVTPLNLPIFYSYGLSILTSNALKGGTIVCSTKDVLSAGFWEDFKNFGYTSLAGVPFVYEMLNRIGFPKKRFPSLRYLTQAGGKLNLKTLEAFKNYAFESSIPFFVMYGQTEATARMSYLQPEFLTQKMGSIGKAIPQGEFSLDPDSGELLYKGPNIFGGYATNLKDLQSYQQEPELKTGDVASVDEEGFYFITGRIKRFVKLFGARINLDEVEHLLKDEFQNNFYCCGIQDKFLLIVSDNFDVEKSRILDFLRLKLDIHPSALKYEQITEVPLTPNGKTDYLNLSQQYGA